ncbi:MlaD family protein [Sandaracinobacter sp. RS1-74]|uniref:MlaD family protein n=1 Tax=Sandaracinobacteroides sayramensis TaxID=2913411 RepID=UPI001EDC3AB9|nr:MlaD family protein [Sandaracinobacteroides sayramensis]MCG2840836.1 MlaD family protein [Sandaracinobacteroides sayramensis]
MENRQSHVIVGAITFVLVLALIGFVLWLARFSREEKAEFDIFFNQSVSGLTVGSSVSFSGVPVGQVRRIALMPETPQFIRVRIELQPDTPVLEGTTATLQSVGFTGVTEIQLSGSVSGQRPLTQPGPYGVPVIPARQAGFGQLLESAPQVLDRASTLLARLNEVFDDENRARFASLVDNLDRVSSSIAAEGPAMRAAIREAETAMKAATRAADSLALAGENANSLITEDGKPLVAELRRSVTAAEATLKRVDALAAAAKPGVQSLASQTVPQVNQLVADLRDVSQQMGALAAKLDEDPLAAVTGGRPLPDYQPAGEKQKK